MTSVSCILRNSLLSQLWKTLLLIFFFFFEEGRRVGSGVRLGLEVWGADMIVSFDTGRKNVRLGLVILMQRGGIVCLLPSCR